MQEEIEKIEKGEKAVKKKTEKGGKTSVGVFILGLIVLIAGVAFLIVSLVRQPKTRDAEYLVSVGKWVREDVPEVAWDFTEIGKGSLTTNSHTNDYDFIWAMEGNKLKIETKWLYNLNDEFEYKIKDDKLVLNDKIVFVPAE